MTQPILVTRPVMAVDIGAASRTGRPPYWFTMPRIRMKRTGLTVLLDDRRPGG